MDLLDWRLAGSDWALGGRWCESHPAKSRDYAEVFVAMALGASFVSSRGIVSAFTGGALEIAGNSNEFVFAHLRDAWRKERGPTSWVEEMIVCPSYVQIIDMGQVAVPLIIEQLRREGDNPDHWYVALETLTGENPVPESAYGDTVKIARAWLEWAKEKGL